MGGIGLEMRAYRSSFGFDEHAATNPSVTTTTATRRALTQPSLSIRAAQGRKVEEPACKPDSVPAAGEPAADGGHLSGSRVAATLVQPTREHRAGHPLPARPCSGWGLPSRPIARPLVSSYLTVSPLPLFETVGTEHGLERWAVCLCGTFRGSPRLGVTQHPALWSPDFPRRKDAATARPTPPPASIRGGTLALFEQLWGGPRWDVVLPRPGQPRVHSLVRQAVGLAVELAGDVLETDLDEAGHELPHLAVQADQGRILDPEPAGELF